MFFSLVLLLFICSQIVAQSNINDFITNGTEPFAIINISRSFTFQEFDTQSEDSKYMIYINDKSVCDISCRQRVSIVVDSVENLKITMKFIADKRHPQQRLDKYYHPGPPLELNVKKGVTYYLNVDLKEYRDGMINLDYKLVEIPESESMFKDKSRYKKNPDIQKFQYNLN